MKDERFYKEPTKIESCLFVAAKKGWLSVIETIFNNFEFYVDEEKKRTKMEFFISNIFPIASKSGHVHIMKFIFENAAHNDLEALRFFNS